MEPTVTRAVASPPPPQSPSGPLSSSSPLLPTLPAPRPAPPQNSDSTSAQQRSSQRGAGVGHARDDSAGAPRSASPCPSDLSLYEGVGSVTGNSGDTTRAFPTVFLSPPVPPPQPSWHGVIEPSMGGSFTQPHGVTPGGGGGARGPLRGRATPLQPLSTPSTPPASSSLLSLQQHHTGQHSALSTPRAHSTPHHPQQQQHAAGGLHHSPPQGTAALTGPAKGTVRRRPPHHRLDSAQARRAVVEKQRHRKLFEVSNKGAEGRLCWDSVGADAAEKAAAAAEVEAAAEASVGWMAALAAPVHDSGSFHLLDGELLSLSAAPSHSLMASPRHRRSLKGGAGGSPSYRECSPKRNSQSGTAESPHHPLSSTKGHRSSPSNRGLGDGSFRTTASLTSLQHRLWQHTTTAVMAASFSHKGAEAAAAAAAAVRKCTPQHHRTLPPAPPSARWSPSSGLQLRSAAAVAMRQGRYAAHVLPGSPMASMDAGMESSRAGGADPHLARALSYPPPGVTTTTLTTTATAGAAAPLVVVRQWESSLGEERLRGREGKRVAQWLVQALLTSSPSMDLDRSRYASLRALSGGGGGSDGSSSGGEEEEADEEDGHDGGLLRSLSERAAVATYLLSTLVGDGLPRHQQSVLPYVRMLIEFACVPDTPVIRAALGQGSVQDEALLDRLARCDRCLLPFTGTTTLPPSSSRPGALNPTLSDSVAGRGGFEAGGETAMDLLGLLSPTFTRQTYITAHFDLAGRTVALAHEVRCRELHQRNVPRLLELTHKNWMRGLMRAVLRAWRFLCQERRVQEQRQRARWALRWTNERMRISLRRWRGYAALTVHMAEADNVAKTALAQKRGFIERLEREAAAMLRSSQQLHETLQQQDEEREVVEGRITQQEILYQRLLQQVREVDRVGSLMLNSLLLERAPPRFRDISAIAGLASPPLSRFGSRLNSITSDDAGADSEATSTTTSSSTASGDTDNEDGADGVDDASQLQQQPHAVTALPTLLQWASDCSKDAEKELLALYPEEPDSSPAAVAAAAAIGDLGQDGDARRSSTSTPSVELYVPADFVALLQSATSEVNTSDTLIGETVLLPLHKLLLVMRGCSGVEGTGGVEKLESTTAGGGGSAAATPPLSLLTQTADGDGMSLNALTAALAAAGDAVADASGAPSLSLIRTVQLVDAAVVKAACTLLEREGSTDAHPSPSAAATTRAAAAGLAGEAEAETSLVAPGASVLLRLPREKRETLQRVCRVVMDAYEQLTGTACVVTAEQLLERSRGTLLVFLAALMRHYTNWMVRRTQQALPTTSTTTDDATTTTAAAAAAAAAAVASSQTLDSPPSPALLAPVQRLKKGRRSNSEGVPHRRYDEWSHPPHSHRKWRRQVCRQAEWIALSFSALHDAMRVARLSSHVLTVVQQDHVSGLLGRLSLTEFFDLLPNPPDQTMQCYVDMIGAVERYAPSLHLLFHRFALPLAKLRADGAVNVAAKAKQQQRRSLRGEFGQSSENPDKALYITANTVWYLLCLTGLAGEQKEEYCATVSRRRLTCGGGGGGDSDSAARVTYHDAAGLVTPPLSAALHRPAVFSLIEQVTQNGVASTAMTRRRSSTRQPGDASPMHGGYADMAAGAAEAGAAGSVVPSTAAFTVSCKTRPRPCFARALREGRHVDLRQDTGAVCMNYTQFVKVLIRLAHAWQCMQQQQAAAEQDSALPLAQQQQRRGTGDAVEDIKDAEGKGKDAADGRKAAAAAATDSHPSTAEVGKERRPSLSAANACATAVWTRVVYEAGNYARTISMPYLHAFFGERFLPRLLGSTRWSSTAQRAMCSQPVLQVLGQHHDDLLDVFNNYQQPREARGVRSSLPPPYSTVLASQLFARVVDAGRQSNTALTTGGGRSMSHAQRASLMYGLNSSMIRRGSNGAAMGVDDDGHTFGDSTAGRGGKRGKQNSVVNGWVAPEDAAMGENLRASIATAQRTDISIVSVLQWTDVMKLAKEMRWYAIRRVTEDTLRRCFEHVRADVGREGDAIFFAEFLQLLCAVSAYAHPSPTMSLEAKLKTFLDEFVLTIPD